jgi:hypothetical protein
MARRVQRLSTPGKEAWHPFPGGWPPDWLKKFRTALKDDPEAERLWKYFVPRCSFVKVGAWATAYVHDSQCFNRDRKVRMKDLAADLRKEDRRYSNEIDAASPKSWIPGKGETIEDFWRFLRSDAADDWHDLARKRQRLDHVRRRLKYLPRLANTKRLGREDSTFLFLIREYVEWKSRAILKGKDLAAIVRAAYVALSAPLPEQISGDDLLRRMRRFERNNAESCDAMRKELQRSEK